jgi:hypothetical protein
MTTPTPATPQSDQTAALDRLIEAQNVSQTATFDHLLGTGRDLWTDAEFDQFMAAVKKTRSERE